MAKARKKNKGMVEVSSLEQEQQSLSWLELLLLPIFLVSVTALVYYPSLSYGFQFDDVANIPRHFSIRHNGFFDLFVSSTRWISYWLNTLYYKIGKFEPFWYRAGNLCLHSMNGLLIFFFLLYAGRQLQRRSFFKEHTVAIAFCTALLFLVHPVQTQTVSYVIQGQLEGLATFFVLSMSMGVLLYHKTHSWLGKALELGVLCGLAFLACGSKEIAIITPLLLVLIDWFFVAQGSWSSLRQRLWLHGMLACIMVGMYIYFLKPSFFTTILECKSRAANNAGNIITSNPKDLITPWYFFISQFKVILHYLWIFVWPFGISVEYDWVLSTGLLAPDCIIPLFILFGIGYLVFRFLQHDRGSIPAFCLLWFFICILPRSSIIPSPELLVDYKTYMASFGWLVLLASGLVKISTVLPRLLSIATRRPVMQVQTLFTLLVCVSLGWATRERNTVWESGTAFWGNILKNAPTKARAYNNYGVELAKDISKCAEAIPYFKKAIELDKHYSDPCNNIAVAYSYVGDIDGAIKALQRSVAIEPNHPEGYNNLASFFLAKKEFARAEQLLHIALQLRPHYGKAYYNLGRVYTDQGQLHKAWEYFKIACMQADLDNELGFAAFAKASFSLKKWDDAIFGFSKALEYKPDDTESLFNLASTYFFVQRYDDALATYQKLLTKQPAPPRIVFNMGETYFLNNQYDKALECYTKLEAHNQEFPQIHLRVASCFEKAGSPDKAYQYLQTSLQKYPMPSEVQIVVKDFISHLAKRHKLIA
ncbi:MAG TPA: tetratricopeptide repeat protein [Candidatus Limnocylindria bacterium]|nr:tetratricopeptide repeat protein [Candidatus Limnocylindria bacterium]